MRNLILATQRNHALEHATIHILSERFPRTGMGGHSNPTGFFVVGNLPTEAVREAVLQALTRLQNGERQLALHPGCGTNYAVTGGLTALLSIAGLVGTRNTRERMERLPLLMLLSIFASLFGPPLGMLLQQRLTTQADLGSLQIESVTCAGTNLHRVITV